MSLFFYLLFLFFVYFLVATHEIGNVYIPSAGQATKEIAGAELSYRSRRDSVRAC